PPCSVSRACSIRSFMIGVPFFNGSSNRVFRGVSADWIGAYPALLWFPANELTGALTHSSQLTLGAEPDNSSMILPLHRPNPPTPWYNERSQRDPYAPELCEDSEPGSRPVLRHHHRRLR